MVNILFHLIGYVTNKAFFFLYVTSYPAHGEVYSIQYYVLQCVNDLHQVVVFAGYSGFLNQ